MYKLPVKFKNCAQVYFNLVSLARTNQKMENEILVLRHKNLNATSDKIHAICLHQNKVEQKGNHDENYLYMSLWSGIIRLHH